MEMRDHLRWPDRGDEADIARARTIVGAGRPDAGIGIDRAQIDLLAAELDRRPAMRPVFFALDPEHALIPGRGDLDVTHVEDQVIDPVYGEAHYSNPS